METAIGVSMETAGVSCLVFPWKQPISVSMETMGVSMETTGVSMETAGVSMETFGRVGMD